MIADDRALILRRLQDPITTDDERDVFEDMLARLEDRGQPLTEKQRAWLERRDAQPEYESLVSSGKVSSVTKIQTIPALRRENLP